MNVPRPRRWTYTVIHYGYVEFAFNYESLHVHHSVRQRQHSIFLMIFYYIFILLLPTKI